MTTKRKSLILALDDADRRFNIAISKMSEITNRVHELEIKRNESLKVQFLNGTLDEPNRDDLIYCEVVQGYRSMSRRKNELEEERNYYVWELEKLK
uniref:ORF25 n=1 Tax=Nitrosopumilaceae spindle-shaped virus TaxID=3065433 RepID=A0AAT9JAT5_9VIRU